jgi:nitrite reductase/ring-hydroxylating ferredoxin subunit
MARHVLAAADEIAPGASKLVTISGREIGVFNVNGEYFALLNLCPHAGAALCRGKVTGLVVSEEPGKYQLLRQGEMLRCPWHGWEFDIKTGRGWTDTKARVRRFYPRREEDEVVVSTSPGTV